MYIMKISKDNQLIAVAHYNNFQNAIADVADHAAFDLIPDEIINSMGEWGNPAISCHSVSETGISDDFEFKYPCGILIYIGSIWARDEVKEN